MDEKTRELKEQWIKLQEIKSPKDALIIEIAHAKNMSHDLNKQLEDPEMKSWLEKSINYKNFQHSGNETLRAYEQKLADDKTGTQNFLKELHQVNKYNEQLKNLKNIVMVRHASKKYMSSKATAQDILTIVNSRSRNQPTASPLPIEFQKVLAEAKGIQELEQSKKMSREDRSGEFESYDKDVEYLVKGIFQ